MLAITTRFLSPTNTKGSMVVAECIAARVIIPIDYALNYDENEKLAVITLLDKIKCLYSVNEMISGDGLNNQTQWVFNIAGDTK